MAVAGAACWAGAAAGAALDPVDGDAVDPPDVAPPVAGLNDDEPPLLLEELAGPAPLPVGAALACPLPDAGGGARKAPVDAGVWAPLDRV